MASSNKTAFLGLNHWEAADKPKRDDFNSDNRLIDAGVQKVSQGLAALTALCEETGAAVEALRGAQDSQGGLAFGTYSGDSAATHRISLGYAPRFVLVFPADKALFEATFSTGALYIYSAAGIPNHAARGLRLESDGFTVAYGAAVNAGISVRTNQSGITYVYVAAK